MSAYHAWTHRAPWQGGTDPIEPQLPYVSAPATPVTVTDDVELEVFPVTNHTGVFAWDEDDPAGVLILQSGTYLALAMAESPSGDQTVLRQLSILRGRLSAGPFAGDDFGAVQWWLGSGQGAHSMNAVTSTSGGKTILNAMGLQTLTVPDSKDADDIYRLVLFLDHQGTNFQVSQASLTIVRIGTDNMVLASAPTLTP